MPAPRAGGTTADRLWGGTGVGNISKPQTASLPPKTQSDDQVVRSVASDKIQASVKMSILENVIHHCESGGFQIFEAFSHGSRGDIHERA